MNKENYPSWLVPIDLAKKLKEIGFKEECEAYIKDEGVCPIYPKAPKKNYNENCDTTSIPSYTQIFDWFETVRLLTNKENFFLNFFIEDLNKEEHTEHKKAILNFKTSELIEKYRCKKNENNYTEWLVSLDIAEKLKEIGFSEPCEYFFNTFDNEIKNYGIAENYNDIPTVHFSIPSYEQVFKWFREKGIVGIIRYLPILGKKIYVYGIYTGVSSCEQEFSTYQEAREKLINRLIEVYVEHEQAKKEREKNPCSQCENNL
ncbi:MAG: hypothetical protein Q3983_07550 [Capnocytophaga sp.]|nr:hypothetical protein [Capnocytophaga sp.]